MITTTISAVWKPAAETESENVVACECLGSSLFQTKRGTYMGTVPGSRFRDAQVPGSVSVLNWRYRGKDGDRV
jgi:hypothetical protein